MSKYWRYLWYILKHKWYVLVECCRLGVPWLGVVHDLSKFGLTEFVRSAWRYCGTPDEVILVSEQYKLAWLHHQKVNKHHWIYWVVFTPIPGQSYDEGWGCIPMPDRYRREMLADWIGAGKTYGGDGPIDWYEKNRGQLLLHPDTRDWLEEQLRGIHNVSTEQVGNRDVSAVSH